MVTNFGIYIFVQAAGGFAGAALSLHDLVVNIKEIRDNRTEASQSLQTAARKMKENSKTLRKMIEAQQYGHNIFLFFRLPALKAKSYP